VPRMFKGNLMSTILSLARIETGSRDEARQFRKPAPSSFRTPVTISEHLHMLREFSSRQQFSRNETIFSEGDDAIHVYRIISGSVRLCRHMPDGRRHIADFMLPGDLIGFAECAEHPFTAEAITTVTLTSYPRNQFDRLGEGDPQVRANLLSLVSTSLWTAQQHQFVLSCQNAKERLASFILRMAVRTDVLSGGRLDLSMGRQDIADHLGLTIETICRAIAALKSDGTIAVPNSHQLILKDTGALRALSEGNVPQ